MLRLFSVLLSVLILSGLNSSSVLNAAPAEADTVEISFQDFVEQAMARSGEIRARRQAVRVAETRRDEAEASRFLPSFNVTTAHGLIPGVKNSNEEFSSSALYLDPTLRNDWEDWAFFNQFEIQALQPLYTWGALTNAIKASRSAVDVARFEFEANQMETEMQLFQLYQGRLLATELKRLIDEAKRTLRQAERELNRLFDEGSSEIDDADLYQFEIFQHEFEAQVTEVDQNIMFLERAWNIALGSNGDVVYKPAENFLDPVPSDIESPAYYVDLALRQRPEVQQLDAVKQAAEYGLKATQAQNYPSLFLGANYRFAYAPNRPRQRNPFISNPSNTSSLTVGIGLQQNLNFVVLNSRTERARVQRRQAGYAFEAAQQGIELDVSDKYKDAIVARSKMNATDRALDVSRQWLRQEQLDFDIGFGDVSNLVDAVRKSLELEAEQRQRIHDFNIQYARLLKASGMGLSQIMILYEND